MIDRTLIDVLNLEANEFAVRWKNLIRKAIHLKHYQKIDDDVLIQAEQPCYQLLSRTLDRGFDRSQIGEYFVKIGKERMRNGIPISEVIYAVSLAQKVVIEYLLHEFAPDNHMRMYQSLNALDKVSEFFLLGSFYMTKGFLEETYTSMSVHDEISDELLKKYFRDDLFFKKE